MQLFIPDKQFYTARLVGASRWFLGASINMPLCPRMSKSAILRSWRSHIRPLAPEMRAIAASVER